MSEAGSVIEAPTAAVETALPRPLSTFDATMIAVGIVVGAGIFKTPAMVAEITGSPALMMTAWALGGLLSFFGALTYAELASSYPSTGGDYSFLTRAYGRNVSFFFAWARSTVIVTGSIALLGFILGDYLSRVLPLGAYSSAIYAALAVITLTAINLAGLPASARMQNGLTLLEVTGVFSLVVAGAAIATSSLPTASVVTTQTAGPGAFGLAMVFVLLTYGGWNEVAYVSAELTNGPRAITRALVAGIVVITTLYLAVVIAAWWGLGFDQLKRSETLGVDLLERAFGPLAGQTIGVVVAIAALTSMNATMLVGARSNHALGHDWRAFSFMHAWRDEGNVPVAGLLVQAAIALILVAFGAFEADGFSAMVEFTAPVFWFFLMLSGIALFVLRRKHPAMARPFRVPGYPVVPAIFVATCAYLFYSSVRYAHSQNAIQVSLLVMASGFVAWLLARRGGTVQR